MAVPEKYFTPSSRVGRPGFELAELDLFGRAPFRREGTSQDPATVATGFDVTGGSMREGDSRRHAKDHEHRFPRFEMQRHGRAAFFDRCSCRLDLAGVGMPEFGFLAVDAETGLDFLRAIRAVGDEIEVGIARAAMNPDDAGIERTGELRVLGNLNEARVTSRRRLVPR